jgi:nitrogen fixation NifU-like protein
MMRGSAGDIGGGLDSLYRELILDHYRRPHAKGLAEGFDGESFQVNPMCGDQVRLRVKVDAGPSLDGADGGVLANVSWDGTGCSISQASASVMADLVQGQDLSRVEGLETAFSALMHTRGMGLADDEAAEALGDAIAFEGVAKYPARIKCALLGWMALKDALAKAAAGDNSPAPTLEGFA